MFVRVSTLFFSVAALASIATASPHSAHKARWSSACNSGEVKCCSSVQMTGTTFVDGLFGYLAIPLPSSGTQVGLTCTPITVGGVGSGAACTQQTVCCNGNTFNGVITTGCSPITINA